MSGYKFGKTSSLFDPVTGEWVGQIDLRGNEQIGLNAAQAAATQALVSKALILVSGTVGATSGWLGAATYPERFGFQLVSGTAVVVVEGSNDQSTVAGTIMTASLDTIGSIQSPPISHPYLYMRATVQSGAGTVNVTRGA